MKKATVLDVVNYLGGFSKMARLLNCSRQYVWYQAKKSKKPSLNFCLKIQKITNNYFTINQLRPDIYISIDKMKTFVLIKEL